MFCYLNREVLQSIYGVGFFTFVCYDLFSCHEGWWKNACQDKENESQPQYGMKVHGESHQLRSTVLFL